MIFRSLLVLLISIGSNSCGTKGDDKPTAVPPEDPASIVNLSDTSQAGIASFLTALSYHTWPTHNTSPVASTSVHGSWVRMYFNPTVATALADGEDLMPVGSTIVKEIYASDRTTLLDHAVMTKVRADSGSSSWVYFEGHLPSYSGAIYGAGHSSCASCHSSGIDYVRASLP